MVPWNRRKVHYRQVISKHTEGFFMTAASSSSGGGAIIIFFLAMLVLYISAYWRLFTKAGEPGWGAIVPIYNLYLYCKIAGRPEWWLILFFIPLVNIVFALIIAMDIAKAFSKSSGFGIGLWLLSFIFVPILGFGSAVYTKPTGLSLA
jgi:hypothetical protein